MNTLALATLLLTLQGAQKAKVSLDVFVMNGTQKVALQSGDKLGGEKQFRVQVQAESPIRNVEFYVGDDVRDTDASTPYEFKLDTLAEEDGDLKLRFLVSTSNGESAEKTILVKIDNGVALGADYHVKQGNQLLGDGKYEDAITSGRLALKADKNSVPARLLQGRAFFALGQLDKAQKSAEDALGLDKGNLTALAILSSVRVQQAFMTVNKSGADRAETLKIVREAFAAAVDARKKVVDSELEKIGSPTADNLATYADVAFRAKRYNRAVQALTLPVNQNPKNTQLANRLIYGLLAEGRLVDAFKILELVKKFGEFDAYTYALQGVTFVEANKDAESDEAMKEALLNGPDSLGVRTAGAYIALKRNKTRVLGDIAKALGRDAETRPETFYFLSALANRTNEYELGRKNFEKAIRNDPLDLDMYIEQGNESILLSQNAKLDAKNSEFQLISARMMFDTALLVRESSPQALTGIAIVSMFQKNAADAVKYAEAATKAAPTYAAGWYAYAAALSYKGLDGREALKKAGLLDVRNLEGRSMPNAATAWAYFNTGGRTPLLSPPSRG